MQYHNKHTMSSKTKLCYDSVCVSDALSDLCNKIMSCDKIIFIFGETLSEEAGLYNYDETPYLLMFDSGFIIDSVVVSNTKNRKDFFVGDDDDENGYKIQIKPDNVVRYEVASMLYDLTAKFDYMSDILPNTFWFYYMEKHVYAMNIQHIESHEKIKQMVDFLIGLKGGGNVYVMDETTDHFLTSVGVKNMLNIYGCICVLKCVKCRDSKFELTLDHIKKNISCPRCPKCKGYLKPTINKDPSKYGRSYVKASDIMADVDRNTVVITLGLCDNIKIGTRNILRSINRNCGVNVFEIGLKVKLSDDVHDNHTFIYNKPSKTIDVIHKTLLSSIHRDTVEENK
jgi:NAD-dependent SIR2 family protein deacetylase